MRAVCGIVWVFAGICCPAAATHTTHGVVNVGNDETFYPYLLEAARKAVSNYNKFREAFAEEQRLLAEVQRIRNDAVPETPHPAAGAPNGFGMPPATEMDKTAAPRFVGIQAHAQMGNVDPLQIYQGLYDTQPLRSPSPLTLTLEEGQAPPSAEQEDEALTAAVSAAQIKREQDAALFEQKARREAQVNELQAQLRQLDRATIAIVARAAPELPSAAVGLAEGAPRRPGVTPVGGVTFAGGLPAPLEQPSPRGPTPPKRAAQIEEERRTPPKEDPECLPT